MNPYIFIMAVQSLASPPVLHFYSLHSRSVFSGSLSSKLPLTPKPSPSRCHRLCLCRRSSRWPGRDAEWLAGSCTRRGCREWSRGPAEGGEPGGSTQPGPRPAVGWRGGNPPLVGPRTLRRSAGPSSRGSSREAAPEGAQESTEFIYIAMWKQILLKVRLLCVGNSVVRITP